MSLVENGKIGFVKVEEKTHCRVDPKVNTDTKEVAPLDIAAAFSSPRTQVPQVQLFNVFAEFVQLPVKHKIQAVTVLVKMCKWEERDIEREGPQKRSVLDMFKIHIESLPLDKVMHIIFFTDLVSIKIS